MSIEHQFLKTLYEAFNARDGLVKVFKILLTCNSMNCSAKRSLRSLSGGTRDLCAGCSSCSSFYKSDRLLGASGASLISA
jgi:hypothetical protein